MKHKTKRLLALLLACCLAGCTAEPAPGPAETPVVPAPDLLPAAAYNVRSFPLEEVAQPRGDSCLSDSVLFFTAERLGETSSETILYAADTAAGNAAPVRTYSTAWDDPASGGMWTELTGFFAGEGGTVWAVESVTEYIIDLPAGFDRASGNVWEFCRVVKNGLLLRQLAGDGTELAVLDVTEHLSAFHHGAQLGQLLVLTTESKALMFRTDGTLTAVIPAPNAVLMMTTYRDAPALLGENAAGQVVLTPLDPEKASAGAEITLPFPYHAISNTGSKYHADVSGRGTNLYFPCQGNLFSCSADSGKVQKLVDWVDLGINPIYVTSQHVTAAGSIAALYRPGGDGALQLLYVTPSEQQDLTAPALTLGTLSADINTLQLVLEHNADPENPRVRVVNYAEYAAMGQSAQAMLRIELARGEGPDLLYSPERDLPVTELAANYLEDLRPFIRQDAGLQKEGLIESVLKVQEEDGKLLSVTPCFVFSTAISNTALVGTGTLTVSRALNLYDQLATYNSSAMETFSRQETVLQEHIARNSLLYGVAENHVFNFNNSTLQEGLTYAARFPVTIDWTKIEAFGSTPGWARVREGSQLLLSGDYYGFAALSQDLYAVGDGAVLCGFPDVGGGHVLEIWNTFGMLKSCRDRSAAWSFLRKVLLARTQTTFPLSGLPSNLTAFREKGEEAMHTEGIRTLVNGEQKLEVPGQLSQSQYNAILEAVQKTTARYQEDYEVFAAVWPAAQQYFDGKTDLSAAVSAAQSAAQNYHTPSALR